MKILSLAILILMHPVHVSLTGIEYDPGKRVYSVFVKVFSDDLATDMKEKPGSEGEMATNEKDRYLKYLSEKIMIIEDGKQLEMALLKTETDGIEHRFNLEARGDRGVRNITVVNRIMTRLYTDQANMLLFSYDGIEDGYKFTAADTLKNYCVK